MLNIEKCCQREPYFFFSAFDDEIRQRIGIRCANPCCRKHVEFFQKKWAIKGYVYNDAKLPVSKLIKEWNKLISSPFPYRVFKKRGKNWQLDWEGKEELLHEDKKSDLL